MASLKSNGTIIFCKKNPTSSPQSIQTKPRGLEDEIEEPKRFSSRIRSKNEAADVQATAATPGVNGETTADSRVQLSDSALIAQQPSSALSSIEKDKL